MELLSSSVCLLQSFWCMANNPGNAAAGFLLHFSQAYTQCVIKEIRCEMEHKETYENGRMLHAAPVSSTVLKSGYLLKVSGARTNEDPHLRQWQFSP